MFSNLPAEILYDIVNYLDAPAPSQLGLRCRPSFDITTSVNPALKSLSVVNKRLRDITLGLLFKHSRLLIGNTTAWDAALYVIPFVQFINRNRLSQHVESLTVVFKARSNEAGDLQRPADGRSSLLFQWGLLLSSVNLSRVTVVASPLALPCLLFGQGPQGSRPMPISFSQFPLIVSVGCPRSQHEKHASLPLLEEKMSALQMMNQCAYFNLFASKDWHSLLLNEGFSVPGRDFQSEFWPRSSTKVVPSLVLPVLADCGEKFRPSNSFPQRLCEFDVIAVYPWSEMYFQILKIASRARRLCLQFLPSEAPLPDGRERPRPLINNMEFLGFKRKTCADVSRKLKSGRLGRLREVTILDAYPLDGSTRFMTSDAEIDWKGESRPRTWIPVQYVADSDEGEGDCVHCSAQPSNS